MKLLMLGCAGILGRALRKELAASHDLRARDLVDYDIRDPAAFAADLDRERPQAVINAAAYTQVDKAESEPELALAINADAPGRLAAACCSRNILFIHLGTDYIFDGRLGRPYREDDPPGPLNLYGQSKLEGELAVRAASPELHLIIRSSWLFGAGGRSFVQTMLDKYRAGERRFRVVNDQRGRPTYAPDLARAIGVGLATGLRGTYHVANPGAVTWYEFAGEIFRAAGVAGEVEIVPVGSEEFKAPARRPRNSVLDTARFEAATGLVLPPHRDALARFLAEAGPQDPGSIGARP
jgi:dTDP-4-dehydrorhamnose reductase